MCGFTFVMYKKLMRLRFWQGCNLIRNTRRDMYGDDKFRAIEMKYGNGTKTDNFLMFSIFWSDEDGPQRILGFSLNPLIKLLKYKKLFLHVDATFDGAPRGFYQVVIFSVIDNATSMHTPIFFCPMTKKSEEAYNLLWSHIVSIVGEFPIQVDSFFSMDKFGHYMLAFLKKFMCLFS